MARRFRGESVHKVDAKGRVSIPAAFRRVLQEGDPDWNKDTFPHVTLVYGDHRRQFIEGFTMNTMTEVDDKIAQMPRAGKARRLLERMFSGQAVQIQIDNTGRLVLAPKLRDKLGITDEAYFIAAGDTFQIWEPATYDAQTAKVDEWYNEFSNEFGDDFDPLSLLDADLPES